MNGVGSGDSSRTSVPKNMPPPPDMKQSNELYKSKIIRIDIYNSVYLLKFIYRYEKNVLLIWINQIINKYQYMYLALK